MYKINVDGATSNDGRPSSNDGWLSSVKVIIRDGYEEPVAAFSKVLQGQCSRLETEIVVLEKGILLAKEMELSQVIFELDALIMVQDI